jgi:hypothetical protein
MTNLSPAAQAVRKAYYSCWDDDLAGPALAAALRAAADQVVPATTWPEVCKDHRDYFGRKQVLIRDKLLTIAAELEGQ